MLDFVSMPQFPSVGSYPGVPPLLGQGYQQFTAAANAAIAVVSDIGSVMSLFAGPQWGIFDQDGNPVAVADTVLSVDYRKEMRISTFPIERGGFQSYNKVQTPYDVRVTFVVSHGSGLASYGIGGAGILGMAGLGGSGVSVRSAFLEAIEKAVNSLDFYTVITPEATYRNANLVHLDYRREMRSGISALVVDVWMEEVRATATAAMAQAQGGDISDPQSPTSSPANNNGPTQSSPVAQDPAKPAPTVSLADTGGQGPGLGGAEGPTSSFGAEQPMPDLGTSAPPMADVGDIPPAMPSSSVVTYPPTPPGAGTGPGGQVMDAAAVGIM